MKRQRGVNVNAVRPIMNNPPSVEDVAAAAMGKKKVKKEGEQKVGKRVVEEEERKESTRDMVGVGGYLQQQQQGGGMMGWNWEENMPLVGGVVDEQMSWGSTWFPGWDMDLLGGDAFTALYNDVLWDDDIWNLNNQIPIPLDTTKRFHLE